MPNAKKHKVRRVVEAVTQTPWALEEGKLASIMELLELRQSGYEFDEDEIRARIDVVEQDDGEAAYQIVDGVAVLPLQGILAPRMNLMMSYSGGTSTQQFAQWFRQVLANDAVHAIVFDVNSPGGSASGNEELAQLIRSARGQKYMVAVATSMMASAAYYVASAADKIVAQPSAELGSIGTYMIHGESSRADANAGRTYTVIKAGDNKAAGNNVEPLTSQTRGVIQERIDNLNDQFVAAVAANRRVSVATVQKNFGQGKVLLAPKAVEAGLADEIGTLDQVVTALAKKAPAASSQTTRITQEESIVDPKIKAALVAAGFIAADASDVVAQVALKAFFAAKGATQPASADDVVLALAAKPPAVQPPAATSTPPAAPPAMQTISAADRQLIASAERTRIEELQARAELLGVGSDSLKAAIEGNVNVEQALKQWTDEAIQTKTPVAKGRVDPGAAGQDVFASAAVEALGRRSGLVFKEKATPAAKELEHRSLLQLAEISLKMAGIRAIGDPDDIARMALRGMGDDCIIRGGVVQSSFNRPGDFPNLLSALAGKMMDNALQYSPATFREWAAKIASVADFKPKTLVATGEFGEFPRVPDGADFTDSTFAEEASWIAVDSYGDEFSMTPRMVVDDDMGAFEEAMKDKPIAHDMTLNRLAVSLLTGNAKAGDGVDLFHATHANIVTTPAPAAPSTAQLAAMRLLLRKQTGVSAKRKLNLTLKKLLIPEDLETVVQQLLSASLAVVPTTETGAQIFRGQVDWIVEPQLGEDSATKYYGFADPSLARAIVYTYQRGFEGMKTRSYFHPKSNCQVYQFEGRFAAAVRQWRGVVQNPAT